MNNENFLHILEESVDKLVFAHQEIFFNKNWLRFEMQQLCENLKA